MEYIKKGELKEGEIYKIFNDNIKKYVYFKQNYSTNNQIHHLGFISEYNNYYVKEGYHGLLNPNFEITTSEEKHWLNSCIERDKFITFEEAMKTFIPEFVLPKKWCIKVTDESRNVINKLRNNTRYNGLPIQYNYATSIDYAGNCNIYGTELTFEQFKKYVLKEEIVEEKVIKPLPQFKIIESIKTITKVENNEGNQFFIGDVVKSLHSNQKGEIIKFKYSADKSNIIAITTFQSNNGIGIDKIEHYIEPKVEVEETLLEKAKRLYLVGTKVSNYNLGKHCTFIINSEIFYEDSNGHICVRSNGSGAYTVYCENKWAKIIE